MKDKIEELLKEEFQNNIQEKNGELYLYDSLIIIKDAPGYDAVIRYNNSIFKTLGLGNKSKERLIHFFKRNALYLKVFKELYESDNNAFSSFVNDRKIYYALLFFENRFHDFCMEINQTIKGDVSVKIQMNFLDKEFLNVNTEGTIEELEKELIPLFKKHLSSYKMKLLFLEKGFRGELWIQQAFGIPSLFDIKLENVKLDDLQKNSKNTVKKHIRINYRKSD